MKIGIIGAGQIGGTLRRRLTELEALRREIAALRQRLASQLPEYPDADELSYRGLVQSANTILPRWDLQGRVIFLNDFGLEFFGYPSDELLGRSVVGTIVPETETSGCDLAQMIAELSKAERAGHLFSEDTGNQRGVGEIHCLTPENSLRKINTPVVWRA
jgi:PAS domain S-box-containing protein